MYSYSFSWKVWKSAKIIASGEEIKKYLTTAVEEEGNFSTALYIIVVFPQAPFRATNVPRPTLVSSNCATAPWLSEEGRR